MLPVRATGAFSCAVLILLAVHCLASGDGAGGELSPQAREPAGAHDPEHHEHEDMGREAQPDSEVGVDERLGERIPPDVVFVDEQGRELRLAAAITKPTLVLLAYYSCPTTCTIMLANLAQAINGVPLELGKDYRVLALSFDEEEGPELAAAAKRNFTRILRKELPREEWMFLTGDKENILSLTDAIGFKFKRTGAHLFVHPNVLLALAPDGSIIRYLYGPSFLPFDIGMALTEAARGTPGLSVRKLLTYCFDYDRKSKSYVFRSFRFLALGILIALLLFFFFVLRKGRSIS